MNKNNFQITIYFSQKLKYSMIFFIEEFKKISNGKEKGKREKKKERIKLEIFST